MDYVYGPAGRTPMRSLLCKIGTLLTVVVGAALTNAGETPAPPAKASITPDGALNVPGFTWPPSEFWSPEFKQAFLKHMAASLSAPANFGLPRMNDLKSAWDAFDAAVDEALALPLTWNRDHFQVDIVESTIAGVHVATLTPRQGVARENRKRVLINLHGFAHGIRAGEVESIPVAALGRIRVITIDYRLEPNDRYPASSEDVAAVYRELLKSYKPGAIGVFGISGGGVLASQVVAWLQLNGLPRPGAVGIFWSGVAAAPFPWGKRGDSIIWGFRAYPNGDRSEVDRLHADLASAYLSGISETDPGAYPGCSDAILAKFPPTLFLSGTRAIDMSASIVSHARLLKLGVDSSLYLMEGGWHGANFGAAQDAPEEHDANAYIARWFSQHLAQ